MADVLVFVVLDNSASFIKVCELVATIIVHYACDGTRLGDTSVRFSSKALHLEHLDISIQGGP